PLLLPLHGDAAPRGQHRGGGLRLAGGGRGRPPEADPQHGEGHAVLRAPRAQEVAGSSNTTTTTFTCPVNVNVPVPRSLLSPSWSSSSCTCSFSWACRARARDRSRPSVG